MAVTATLSAAQLRSIEKAISRLGDSKSANVLVGKAARIAARMHLLQPSKAAMPVASGQLKKATKLRSIKRSRVSAGVRVGFSDNDFVGNQFYGAFQEWSFRIGSLKLGGSRRKMEGRFMLRKVAKIHGKQAQDHAAKLIADAMEQLAKKK
jgi:hypothetical protein